MLTLFTYPLVLIPLRSALRRMDPSLEEAARVMGRGQREVFRSVVLPQLAPAIGAGGVLVALYALSDFGAVSIMRFNSFTRDIYIAYQSGFGRTEAAALGMVLVIVMLVLFARLRARARRARAAPHDAGHAAAAPSRCGSGAGAGRRWRSARRVVGVALVLPVGVLGYWATKQISSGLELGALATNAGHSLLAAAVRRARGRPRGDRRRAAVGALPELRDARRRARRLRGLRAAGDRRRARARVLHDARRAAALPDARGARLRAGDPLPAARGQPDRLPRCCRCRRGWRRRRAASAAARWRSFARSRRRSSTSGVLGGAALVFLHALKELPATLLLAPIGFDTLATDVWRQTSFGFFEASAIPALLLLLIAAPPLYLLNAKGSVGT